MKKKKALFIILGIVVVLAAAAVIAVSIVNRNMKETLGKAALSDVDLKKAADGAYTGNCDAFPISVQVEVTVKDGAITGITLIKHNNGKGKAAEVLPEKVVEAQSVKVDTISGATHSSKAILLAIQDALQKAVK